MYFILCYVSLESNMERHPRASGDPVLGALLDSRVRGNDHPFVHPVMSAFQSV